MRRGPSAACRIGFLLQTLNMGSTPLDVSARVTVMEPETVSAVGLAASLLPFHGCLLPLILIPSSPRTTSQTPCIFVSFRFVSFAERNACRRSCELVVVVVWLSGRDLRLYEWVRWKRWWGGRGGS